MAISHTILFLYEERDFHVELPISNRLSHVVVNKADFLKILEDFQRETVTPEERTMLIRYYDAFEQKLNVLTAMTELERRALKEEMLGNILKKIDSTANPARDQHNSTTVNQKD